MTTATSKPQVSVSAPPSTSCRAAFSRRQWLFWPLGLVPLAACQEKQFACDSSTGLTPQQLTVRTQLAYVDRTPNPEADCANCQQFVPAPKSGECGTCKVMPGPAHPKGFCKVWVKTA